MDQYAAVFGRLHPAILHLPIGLIVGVVVLEMVGVCRRRGLCAAPASLVWLAAAFALLAALSGLKLSQEEGYGGWTLTIHLWLGIAVAVFAVVAAVARSMAPGKVVVSVGEDSRRALLAGPPASDLQSGRAVKTSSRSLRAYRISLAVVLVLIVFTGHFGGVMTHGEDFVLAPLRARGAAAGAAANSVAPEPVDFAALGPTSEQGFEHIAPILAQHCNACHSGDRAKGGLALDSFEALMRGSAIGEVVSSESPADSELLRRIELPLEDPDHMPPMNKRQLSPEQIALVRAWVLGQGSSGAAAAAEQPPQGARSDATSVDAEAAPPPDAAALEALRATLAHVAPLAEDSPLLWIDAGFAEPPLTEAQIIGLLTPLASNVAELMLARCAVTDEIATLAAQMPNLRRLSLHGTAVTDGAIAALAGHPQLAELVLTKTAVSDSSIEHLLAMPALSRVYLWGSKATAGGAARLQEARPGLAADAGELREATQLLSELDPEFVDAGPKAGAGAVSLAPVNTACPVSGAAVDANYLVVHEGKVIGFCCADCPRQFWAEPARFAEKLK